MSGEEDTDKSYDATPQKLLDARKKGEIAKSTDLLTAAGYIGLLVAFMMSGPTALRDVATVLMMLLDQSAEMAEMFAGDAPMPAMGGFLWDISLGLLPFFALPAIGVILAVFAQQAWVFAPSKVAPKLSRISVISNAKNKFGRSGLFEFFKSFTKLMVYSICVAIFINANLTEMVSAMQTSPHLVLSLLAELCVVFLFIVVVISGVIGGIDAVWQHFEHLRKNKMSHKEIMDENKNQEGDPHMKQERRQRAMSITQNQMMADVPKADVVIVNPTHYAIALKWSRLPGEAPACVAKGVDEVARVIRERAMEHGVPVHSDPPTARALHATTQIGEEIAHEHYHAVAAAIRFAEAMRQKAKDRI